MQRKAITFISHQASRTGAPLLLLRALMHMQDVSWDQEVILLQDGVLQKDFAEVCPTILWNARPKSGWTTLRRRQRRRVPDMYYINSHAYEFLHQAKAEGIPAVCHVHEISFSFMQVSSETMSLFRTYPSRYIAVSQFVKKMLVDIGVDEGRIEYVPSGIDPQYWKRFTDGNTMRQQCAIPKDAVVVGMSGQIIPLKGVDLWLQMAKKLCQKYPEKNWHFVWVGSPPSNDTLYARLMRNEAENLGISDRVHFVGERTDPRPYYEMFDVFTLSSRMESLSLVCLENTLMGTPVVAFSTTGGPQEFSRHGFVHLCETPDPTCMAESVNAFIESPEKISRLLQIGAERIPHAYNIHNTAKAMHNIIQSAIQANHVK